MKRRVDASLRDPARARAQREARARRHPRASSSGSRRSSWSTAARTRACASAARSRALAALAGAGYVDAGAGRGARATPIASCATSSTSSRSSTSGRRRSSRPTRTSCARWCAGSGLLGPDGEAEFWRRHAAHTGVVARRRSRRSSTAPRRSGGATSGPELATLIESLDHEEQAAVAARPARVLAISRRRTATCGCCATGRRTRPRLPRRRQALAALAPSMLAEIASSAAPDRALHHMATFITRSAPARATSTCCSRIPASAACSSGSSPPASSSRTSSCATPSCSTAWCAPTWCSSRARATTWRRELAARLGAAADFESELDTLRRFRTEEFLRIGVHDIQGELRPPRSCRRSSRRWPTCVSRRRSASRWRDVTHRFELPPEAPTEGLAVVAMGKLGGAELNYHSDLDLIFVYDAGDAALVARSHRAARVLHARRAAHDQRAPDADARGCRLPDRHAPASLRQPGTAGVVARGVRGISPHQRAAVGAPGAHQGASRRRPRGAASAPRADDHPFRLRPRPRSCRASPRCARCAGASRRSGTTPTSST